MVDSDRNYPYDIAISYAGEDRIYAEALAKVLISRGVKVFYDKQEKSTLWGKNLYTYLTDIYQNKAHYCVMFLSQHYASQLWTNHEREAAQARALIEQDVYNLPIRLDETEIPGILPTIGSLNWYEETPEKIAEYIITRLQLDTKGLPFNSSLEAEQNIDDYPHLADLSVQVTQLIHPASNAPEFDLRISIGNSYDDIINGNYTERSLTPEEILLHDKLKRLLIHAPGGCGKTAVVCLIAKKALSNGQIVFFLDLKTGAGDETLPKNFDLPSLFDIFSVEGSINDFLRALNSKAPVLLLIDGLNEIYGPTSDVIVKMIEKLARDHRTLRVIITDRMNPHEGVRLLRGTVEPLAEAEILRLLPVNAKVPFKDANQQLMSTPFFLDLQLRLWSRTNHPNLPASRVLARNEMFFHYFSDVAKVQESEWPQLREAAFEAYAKYSSRTFESDWWSNTISPNLAKRLDESGLTVIAMSSTLGQNKIIFRHQLLHDFLVGDYLAHTEVENWNSTIFDKATFKTNSIECLSFAAEILGDEAEIFLIKACDWSYRSVTQTIADLKKILVSNYLSNELEFVIETKNAEKLFKIFEETINGARKRLTEASTPTSEAFLRTRSIDDIKAIVEQFMPASKRFKEWKRIVLLEPIQTLSEKDFLLLDGDPIIGWEATNSYRRMPLNEMQLAQIRMMYYHALSTKQDVLRWRIAHLLGAFPLPENKQLLMEAAFNDEYEWTRYGAVRSLMQIASQSEEKMRDEILSELASNLHLLDSTLLLQDRELL